MTVRRRSSQSIYLSMIYDLAVGLLDMVVTSLVTKVYGSLDVVPGKHRQLER
jgi:hypothetical protein